MEKDAAVVSREAEEEQHRAEEDAASLRAELNSLRQQAINGQFSGITAMGYSSDHMQAMEKELANLKSLLEEESKLRQLNWQKLVDEQTHSSTLICQKQELELKLESLSKAMIENDIEKGTRKLFSMEDKERLEKQSHDMAIAVERLEGSRQKLLLEIDSQSSEIERFFEENSSPLSAHQEAMGVVAQWQAQRQLAKERSRAEAISAEVLQLSARLQQAIQAYNGLARSYYFVLRNIETNLMKLKQDGSVSVQ